MSALPAFAVLMMPLVRRTPDAVPLDPPGEGSPASRCPPARRSICARRSSSRACRWCSRSGPGSRERSGGRRFGRTRTRAPRASPRSARFAALFAVVFAVTFALAGVDWLTSLDPSWASTMFAVYLFAGALVSGRAAVHADRARAASAPAACTTPSGRRSSTISARCSSPSATSGRTSGPPSTC